MITRKEYMKIKTILLLLTTIIITVLVGKTFASTTETIYNFYISDTKASAQEQKILILLSDSVDEKTLISKKIAPRNKRNFFN